MIRSQNSATALTTKVGNTDHLILMRCIEDDRFGNPDKVNGAYLNWAAPHFVTSGHTQIRSYDSVLNALPVEHYYRICGLRLRTH